MGRTSKMRKAKDGKPFDLDNMGSLQPGEVEVIQYLRPDGKRRRMAVPVGEEHVKMAKDLILSAEELQTGEVAVYARKIGEPEEKEIMEIAQNDPGDKSPPNCLKRLIEKKSKEDKDGHS
jgi:hypothetical protein